jgi:hypothetical protein
MVGGAVHTLLLISLPAVWSAAVSSAVTAPPVLWAEGYTFGPMESHPHAGVQTTDGGFLMVGDGVHYGNTTVVQRHLLVLKTSSNGTLEWQLTLGSCGHNYGKFGIELDDGTFLVAGAMCGGRSKGTGTVLKRTLIRLSPVGDILRVQPFDNVGEAENLRDGFMAVSLTAKPGTVVATGFIGGENSSTGYVGEPMFLIYGGAAFVMTLSYDGPRDAPLSVLWEQNIVADGYEASQGMRVLHDAAADAYAVSIASADSPGNFQFGMASVSAVDGSLRWAHIFPASHGSYEGHASHPYALTAATDGRGYMVAGLAVINDAQGIEQCQGRLAKVSSSGDLRFDRRFTSALPGVNIECYGIAPAADGGTGAEPELHPHASQKLKTWRMLVHRTDAEGTQQWERAYTSNE